MLITRASCVLQRASLGNSPDAIDESRLRKRGPVFVPLLQRLHLKQEQLWSRPFLPPSEQSYASFNSTGITLTATEKALGL